MPPVTRARRVHAPGPRSVYGTMRISARGQRRGIRLARVSLTPAARLDHARQDLARASPGDGITVTAVAYRWGFRSSSRFAAAFRRAYGVSPSHTLNQD